MNTQAVLDEGLAPSPGKRIRRSGLHALTGLRFFAAMYVYLYHFGAGFTARIHLPHLVTVFLEHGNLGVALFFILSGFILCYTYKDNLGTFRDVYKFFVARVARLYPVYFVSILLSGILSWRFPTGTQWLIFPMLQSWVPATSTNGYTWNIPAWTISVEAFFYCCFPLVFLIFRRPRSILTLRILVICSAVLAMALQVPFADPGMPDTTFYRHILLPVLCLPEFLFGIALGALFLHHRHVDPEDSVSKDSITLAGIIPCMVLISFGIGRALASVVAIFWFGWTIYRLANGRGWLTNLLSSKPAMLLGGASFSIYLLQSVVRESARTYLHPLHPGLDAWVAPLFLIPFSCLLYLFWEEPMRKKIRVLLDRN
jgi:peptidoglycan/LPS O-acetylase OafA/YrhL